MSVSDDILKEIFKLAAKVGTVPFPNIVRASSGFNVLPLNLKDVRDKELVYTLKGILTKYLENMKKTHQRVEGKRPNEVGKRLETALVHEINFSPLLKARRLGSGYPDVEISQGQDARLSYFELKASSKKEPSELRYFYFSSGNKIKSDARHLILNVGITRESPDYWTIDNFALSDLFQLSVALKAEFNASQIAIVNKDLQIFSSK